MKPDTTLAGTASIVVQYTESSEHFDASVIHPHGDAEGVFSERNSQQFTKTTTQAERFRSLVKLFLCSGEWVVGFRIHSLSLRFYPLSRCRLSATFSRNCNVIH
jgi:hypothetical protein